MSGESAASVHVIDVLLMDRTCKKGWMHSVLFVRSTVARMKEVLKYNDGSLGREESCNVSWPGGSSEQRASGSAPSGSAHTNARTGLDWLTSVRLH